MPKKSRFQPLLHAQAEPVGLDLADQRLLVQLIFAFTGLTLGCFALLQALAGNAAIAVGEITASLILGWATWRLGTVRNLLPWIYAYLLPTFSFLVYIIVMPRASTSAFVWVYLIPVMAYLLLGSRRGLQLSVPFAVLAVAVYLHRFPVHPDAETLIDIGNALLCGVLIMVFMHIYETRRARAQRQLQRMALSDALTGVASREAFQRALQRHLEESSVSGVRWVLVVLDVDHFKQVNDRWGHDAGDKALQHLCRRLCRHLRANDMIGRLGGEEFALLLRNTTRFDAQPLVERLRRDIANHPLIYNGQTIELSATFGLAEWPEDGDDAEVLYRCSDQRLYRGKSQGRNRLVSSDAH
ncbi:MAG: putative signaling protein [Stenotrophomonas maltophilia]|nr:MAG: putative signaling protein [Stenotrophomonas maltophilia]